MPAKTLSELHLGCGGHGAELLLQGGALCLQRPHFGNPRSHLATGRAAPQQQEGAEAWMEEMPHDAASLARRTPRCHSVLLPQPPPNIRGKGYKGPPGGD